MNKFHPLQYVNNTQHIPYNPTSPGTQPLPLIPGPKLYSETVADLKTTMIVTDSMAGGVKAKCLKKNITGNNEQIIFRRFPGHTAEDIAFYVPKPLSDTKPDQVIIVAGTNDLSRYVYQKEDVDEYKVVESILKIGRTAREHGTKKICISSIIVRRGYRFREIIKKVNDLLYMACVAEDFRFIDQDDITIAHVSSDGIHLNSNGTCILLFNILSVFSKFDHNPMNFKDDYQYAISIS